MLTDLLNRPCQIVRKNAEADENEYGYAEPGETVVSTVCELQTAADRSEAEDESLNELSTTRWTIFLPAGTDLDSEDVVIVDDVSYEVDGTPWDARSPRRASGGRLDHVQANLVLVEKGGAGS